MLWPRSLPTGSTRCRACRRPRPTSLSAPTPSTISNPPSRWVSTDYAGRVTAAERIPLTRPSTGTAELEAVAAVLESGWLAGQGPQCALLEQEFAELTGRAH